MTTTERIADRGPTTHELKCHIEPFQASKRGEKNFEFRKDDRGYRVGDTLWLREWEPLTMWGHEKGLPRTFPPHYTGDELHRKVTYIIREGFGIPEGYCIMSLATLEAEMSAEPVACDYRRFACSDTGETIDGKWVCKNHIPRKPEQGVIAPTDLAGVVEAGDAMHRWIEYAAPNYCDEQDRHNAGRVTEQWSLSTKHLRPNT